MYINCNDISYCGAMTMNSKQYSIEEAIMQSYQEGIANVMYLTHNTYRSCLEPEMIGAEMLTVLKCKSLRWPFNVTIFPSPDFKIK